MRLAPRDRWFAAAVIAGVSAVIVAVVVLLRIGIENPSPPPLIATPNPAIPGEILYASSDNCLVLARASGESRRQISCLASPLRLLAIIDTARVAYVDTSTYPETLVVIDAESGREVERRPFDPLANPFPDAAPDGTRLVSRSDRSYELLRDGQVVGNIRVDTDTWHLRVAGWSPDSQWIAFTYFPPRTGKPELWIVSRDGTVRGTLAEQVSGSPIAWSIAGVGSWPLLSPAP
ncbi:hypothetical protein [Tepidiforma sp.]|uniref:TolB family protein n=1 Tax=Tepidiforma sp. TaxID=2682230 RepID=UPI002ADD39DE|nr:hypothetical protein [Tepidiforma sp.]